MSSLMPLERAAYPHQGGCQDCRLEGVCNFCGTRISRATRCTNGRCDVCHRFHCTPGGAIDPGHGYGQQGGRHWR